MFTLESLHETDPLFWNRVRVDWISPIVRGDHCWLWTGRTTEDGYGLVKRRRLSRSPLRANRYAWELAHRRQMRRDMVAMHICDNPTCVNPNHIEQRTQRSNMIDMYRKGRHSRRGWRVEVMGSHTDRRHYHHA